MSALAQLFNPPKVRHAPSRIVIAGVTVTSASKLPQLESAEARQQAKRAYWLARQKLKHEENREKRLQKMREWRKANPEKNKEIIAKWRRENREKYLKQKREGMQRQRDRRKNAELRQIEF